MIVCHCQTITDRDIRAAADRLSAADPAVAITPARIYRALGKRADCGGCLPLFVQTLRPVTASASDVPRLLRTG